MKNTKEIIRSVYYSGYEEGYKAQAYEIIMLLDKNAPIEKIKAKLKEDVELL